MTDKKEMDLINKKIELMYELGSDYKKNEDAIDEYAQSVLNNIQAELSSALIVMMRVTIERVKEMDSVGENILNLVGYVYHQYLQDSDSLKEVVTAISSHIQFKKFLDQQEHKLSN